MNAFEQIQEMKQKLFNDLNDALDRHRVNIGIGLSETDVVGVLEKVKLDYVYDNQDDTY